MNEEKNNGTEQKEELQKEELQKEEIPEDVTLPPASFTSLVMLLSTNALGYMAEIEKEESGKKKILKLLARHTIDTIQVLDEKTKGNLDQDEKDMVDHVLADLQLQYIKYADAE